MAEDTDFLGKSHDFLIQKDIIVLRSSWTRGEIDERYRENDAKEPGGYAGCGQGGGESKSSCS